MRITRSFAFKENRRFSPGARAAFTLLELSAVVAIITVLVSLLCAALNKTKAKALHITCVDNLRQLQLAWRLYADDHDDELPLNQTAPMPKHHRILPWRTSTNSWVTGNPREDLDDSTIRRGLLYPYTRSVAIYKCPVDGSTVLGHPDTPRNRSYSMSAYLGGDEAVAPKMNLNELIRPESIFVFIEEAETSIWLSNFIVPRSLPGRLAASSASRMSTPSGLHADGCNLSFADGHVAFYRWQSPSEKMEGSKLSAMGVRNTRDLRLLQSALPQ